jgi:hypothetical protein
MTEHDGCALREGEAVVDSAPASPSTEPPSAPAVVVELVPVWNAELYRRGEVPGLSSWLPAGGGATQPRDESAHRTKPKAPRRPKWSSKLIGAIEDAEEKDDE